MVFFSEFFCPGRVWTEFGTKFFSLFLGHSQTILDRNNAGCNFFNFSAIFLEFSCLGWARTEFGTKIFLSFSAYLILFWLKIMLERGFSIFLLFFLEFSSPGRVWTNSGQIFFFLFLGLSLPLLDRNNAGIKFFDFLNCFAIFFGIFLPGSSMNGILD